MVSRAICLLSMHSQIAAAVLGLVVACGVALAQGAKPGEAPGAAPAETPARSPADRSKVPPAAEKGALSVVVSIPPLVGLVKPLLPEGATIRSLMPPGRSEHGYEFTPGDLRDVVRADVVVIVGLGLEPRVEKELASRPVDGRATLNIGQALGLKQADGGHDHHGHDHGHGHDHAHDHDHGHDHTHDEAKGWVDQHVWLDPGLVAKLIPQVRDSVAAAMKSRGVLDDASRKTLDEGADRLLARVQEVDRRYTEALSPLKGRAFATHHNAFSRVAERYGLVVAATIRELEDTEPTPSEIARAVKAIRDGKLRAVFVEPQMNHAVPKRIAEAAKVRVGVLDPLGDGDWFAMMEKNLEALVAGLGDGEKLSPAKPKAAEPVAPGASK